jgi:hypothetical protein
MIASLSLKDGIEEMDTAEADHHLCAEIFVCGATDCLSMGSGAAILEIEELASEFAYATGGRVHVHRSGCLGLCGRGPAVKLCLRGGATNGSGGAYLPIMFPGVDSPQRCAEVVATIPGAPAPIPAGDGGPEAQLMERRAAGIRWDALKALSRRAPGAAAPPYAVDAAVVADRQSARSPAAQARADRRAERLRAAAARPTLAPLPSPLDSAGL